MLFNLVNKYGARQAYDTIKVSFWHLLLDPDTDHFRSVAIASPPAGSESVSLSEQSEQRGRGAALEGTAHAANGARQSEAGTGSNSANQPQHTTVHRKSRRQEQPVHLRQHINACLHPVHELYCTAFVLLDRNFRKADALNMEFNLILEQTYAEMEAAMRFVRAPRAFGNVQQRGFVLLTMTVCCAALTAGDTGFIFFAFCLPTTNRSDEHQVDSVEDLRLCLKINMDVEPEDPNEVARQRRRRARSGGIPTPAGTPQRNSERQTDSAHPRDSSAFLGQNQKKRQKNKDSRKSRPRHHRKDHHVSASYARQQQQLPVGSSSRPQSSDSDVDGVLDHPPGQQKGNGIIAGDDGSLGLSDSDSARTALLAM